MAYRRPKVQYVRAARSEHAPFSEDAAYHSPERYSAGAPPSGLGFPSEEEYDNYSFESGSQDLEEDLDPEDVGTATDESPVSEPRHRLYHPRAPSIPESRHSSQSQYYVVSTRHRPRRSQTYHNDSEYVVVPRARSRSRYSEEEEFYEVRHSHRDRSRRYHVHHRRRRPKLLVEEEPKEPPIIDELNAKLTAISEQLEKLCEDETAREILFEQDWSISLKEPEGEKK